MSNKVNFSELKRKEIRKTFGEGEGQIIVYNPSFEQKKEINKILQENINLNGEQVNFVITGKTILLKLIPMLTNIILELDENNKDDKNIIEEVLNDPSEVLMQVCDELNNILNEVNNRNIKNLESMNGLPKEIVKKMIESEETPEQKRIRELKQELESLEKGVGLNG